MGIESDDSNKDASFVGSCSDLRWDLSSRNEVLDLGLGLDRVIVRIWKWGWVIMGFVSFLSLEMWDESDIFAMV